MLLTPPLCGPSLSLYSPAIHEVDLLGEGSKGATEEAQRWPQGQAQLPGTILIINRQKDRLVGWLAPQSDQHREVLRKVFI